MAYQIKKDKSGRRYGYNTKTKKRVKVSTAESMMKKQRTQFRKGGKPSEAGCSTAGRELRVKKTSSAGSILMKCGLPNTRKTYFAKKRAGKLKGQK